MMKRLLVLLLLSSAMASACAPAAASSPAPPSPIASPLPTIRPTRTPAATPTAIPGFEGWSVINPYAVDIRTEGQSVTMALTHKALWFMQQRGVLLYKPVVGDFRITADVHTSKHSDASQPPGGDGSVQLGGVMALNDEGTGQNYVFIVVGDDGDGLSVESKNTVQSVSKFDGPSWDSPDAELRLCRVGSSISVYKRHLVTGEAWVQAATFDRPDFPETLQVGLNIYTDSAPNLQVRYDNIQIESVASQSDCTK